MDEYLSRVRSACYVCEMVAGTPEFAHHIAYRDADAVVFLCKYPAVVGHLMVAPAEHREHVVSDFDESAYVGLQQVVHRAGRALESVVDTERLYVMSLGSQQGNRHVHWHLVPLPPGLPFEEQQLALLSEERGWLDVPDDELAELARRIGHAMDSDT